MSQGRLSNEFEPVERKVQLAGNSTFVVSLPKEWARSQDLESGHSMYLYPHDDWLIAATGTVSDRTRSVTVDATLTGLEVTKRRIESAVRRGIRPDRDRRN
ncbi:hypothetical protein EA473_05195 [Natrarchaeobius chitinivorans]|uniref:AbrB/MazE/SpoVT family DNA-binding domain-containing protein n=1 Tax=Natrarchaeobius chitinivorans TaxID=1679083 RepID=A0A3N6M7A0_NATCH|nr:hypothetical protein EA473_05195 [Natrarchaeobius chitinivorans]